MIYETNGKLAATLSAVNAPAVDPTRLPRGTVIRTGIGTSVMTPTMDFETYSEAGFYFNGKRWVSISGPGKKGGIFAVGAAAYCEHESAEILSLAYDLLDGLGPRLWIPGLPEPTDLFDYLATGAPIEAHNCLFELFAWRYIAERKLGWPPIRIPQLRDSMAKANAFALPGALDKVAKILGTLQKQADGKKLLDKFSRPRNPTKKDPRLRIDPQQDPDGPRLYSYNIGDVGSELVASAHLPELSPFENEVFTAHLEINSRGVQIDTKALADCQAVLDGLRGIYLPRLQAITGGAVNDATEIAAISGWLAGRGFPVSSLDAASVASLVKRDDLPADVREVLTIRQQLGSSSTAKFAAISRTMNTDGRLRDLFKYCGAQKTGRWSGGGAQPQNLPSSGCDLSQCSFCGTLISPRIDQCPQCMDANAAGRKPVKWGPEAVDHILKIVAHRDPGLLMAYTDQPVEALAGCLRGMFIARPGHLLACCDYSAIEAVVLAMLAGEQWRIDIFRTHGRIYEASASQITGIPLAEILGHKEQTGEDHPLRKTVGKVAELASGYQGGVGAWRAFGADKFMTESEIADAVKKWRHSNPAIVKLWNELESCAKNAIKYPGQCFAYRGLSYGVFENVLYCQLPSGRFLKYHSPRLHAYTNQWGRETEAILFYGVDALTGQWVEQDTYGGKLTENACQAVARDIQANGIVNAERAGLPVVLHIHDEVCAEVPEANASADQLAECMNRLPAWCADWPVSVPGGWVGLRYRKD